MASSPSQLYRAVVCLNDCEIRGSDEAGKVVRRHRKYPDVDRIPADGEPCARSAKRHCRADIDVKRGEGWVLAATGSCEPRAVNSSDRFTVRPTDADLRFYCRAGWQACSTGKGGDRTPVPGNQTQSVERNVASKAFEIVAVEIRNRQRPFPGGAAGKLRVSTFSSFFATIC